MDRINAESKNLNKQFHAIQVDTISEQGAG
jgi:hypothetical protein